MPARPHGDTSRFSSADSLSLPVGSRVRPGAVDGYYLDFSSKVTEPRWPPPWLPPVEEQMHVETVQWGLGCFERYLESDDQDWLEAARSAGEYLAELQSDDGGWRHLSPMAHTYRLDPGWLSALPQGEAASLYVRLSIATGEPEFGERARLALRPLTIPTAEGGLLTSLDGGPFLEEYPTKPASFVLNGGIFALWGCYDVGVGLDDAEANAAFEAGVETLAGNLHRYDLGYWSRYDLFPHPLVNVASAAYHRLHINQLDAMQLVSPRPEFAEVRDRFASYEKRRRNRYRAFAAKVAFRFRVPRNRLLARRLMAKPEGA